MARNDGWVTPRLVIKGNKKEIINECLDPQPHWDDWTEQRDGMRGCDDRKSIRNKNMCFAESFEVKRWNKKNKKLVKIRKAKKIKFKKYSPVV